MYSITLMAFILPLIMFFMKNNDTVVALLPGSFRANAYCYISHILNVVLTFHEIYRL